ncbi:ComEC/Rec2 family competence protein [Candidatus Gracilibacteria bacterium]|nr:ComEC/Rec2 family competence protein [Candidatus Gracilibacteria bacterium]
MVNKIFLFFIISILFGILVSNILFNFSLITLFLSFIFIFLMLFIFILKKHHLFLIIIGFGITFGSVYSGINNYFLINKVNFINNFYNQNTQITGEIKELYKKQESSNSYILKINTINNYKVENINALVYYSKNYILNKGDLIKTTTKISKIDNFSPNFNYQKFNLSKNIFFQIFPYNIEKTGKAKLSKLTIFITNTRQTILDNIYKTFPENEAVLLGGILIGAREDMSKDMLKSFNNSGLTHLVAVSGFNITIIIIFLGFLLKFVPSIIRFIIISLFIVFFVLLVGDNIPVVRAGIMGILGYFILLSGRSGDSLTLLLFTAFIFILINPLILNYDSSFHLSFLAVLGLLYFQEFFKKIFYFLPETGAVKESFILTLSAMMTTLPIMLFNFGQVSIFSPIANMLVGGMIPFTMLFGFLTIILNFVSTSLGFLLGFITYFLLKYIIIIANFFGNLDFSLFKLDFGDFNIYAEILYFLILIFLIIYFKIDKKAIKN